MPTTAIPSISVKKSPMPLNYTDTPQTTLNAFIRRSRVTIDGFLFGTAGGSAPASNVGPWLNANSWYYYNTPTGDYRPMPVHIENSGYSLTANSSPTADNTATFNEKSSSYLESTDLTVANLVNIYIPRDSVVLTSGAFFTLN